jgi:multicomponent Na+:H+ antiporter subunit B
VTHKPLHIGGFVLALLMLAAPAAKVLRHMPTFGAHPMIYGDAINAAGPRERKVTNMVSAVNFDYRGVDTMGEEFILLAAVTGAAMLLRPKRGERQSDEPATTPGRPIPPHSEAVMLACRCIAPVTVMFSLYVAMHVTLTPGGGFQGGAIAGSAMLLVFLGERYGLWRRKMPVPVLEAMEGGGALLFVAAGIAPLLFGADFLQNILPLAPLKSLLSGGLMLLENAGVYFAVAGGFSVMFVEFLKETRRDEE